MVRSKFNKENFPDATIRERVDEVTLQMGGTHNKLTVRRCEDGDQMWVPADGDHSSSARIGTQSAKPFFMVSREQHGRTCITSSLR